MLRDRWFRIGAGATLFGGLCCLTPMAVLVMGALGLAAHTIWIDVVAMPLLVIGVGILVASFVRLRKD